MSNRFQILPINSINNEWKKWMLNAIKSFLFSLLFYQLIYKFTNITNVVTND